MKRNPTSHETHDGLVGLSRRQFLGGFVYRVARMDAGRSENAHRRAQVVQLLHPVDELPDDLEKAPGFFQFEFVDDILSFHRRCPL